MDRAAQGDLMSWMSQVPDPRSTNVSHKLGDMLSIAVLAVICGADSAVDIAMFGRAKHRWLRTFLDLPAGIPSHDTFGRVLSLVDPDSFERAFTGWIDALRQPSDGPQLLAGDGKTLRRSIDKANRASGVDMVSLYCVEHGLVLTQAGTRGKGKEAPTMKTLLKSLPLKDTIVTLDALHCRPKVSRIIFERGGDYILQLKANNPDMMRAADRTLASLDDPVMRRHVYFDEHQTLDQRHGREERRHLTVTDETSPVTYCDPNWPGIRSIARVRNERTASGGKTAIEHHLYVSSLERPSAEDFLKYTRGHWDIENGLHWILDMAFREDECRLRSGYAAENMSRLRRIALNLLKQDTTTKAGIAAKRKRCGWDEGYLLAVLSQSTDRYG